MIKCIIWDLDHTLWQGILSEGDKLVLDEEIVSFIKQSDEAGILHSIASRNDQMEAMMQLTEFGIKEYFLYPQFGFHLKALSIEKIAKNLHIGLDSIAFVDDSDFELEEAKYFLPQISTFHAKWEIHRLFDIIKHDDIKTYESSKRRAFITSEIEKEKASISFSGSREEFLKQCQMVLTIRKAEKEDYLRVSELVKRTNQFKLFSMAVDEDFCNVYTNDPHQDILVCELKDQFGYYGIVGVCFYRQRINEIHLDQFCISCRVGGRGIGASFLFQALTFLHQQYHHLNLAVCVYEKTDKNRPVLVLLKTLGFKRKKDEGHGTIFTVSLPLSLFKEDYLQINFL